MKINKDNKLGAMMPPLESHPLLEGLKDMNDPIKLIMLQQLIMYRQIRRELGLPAKSHAIELSRN